MARHIDTDIRDINTMEELRYHQLRLELAAEFLEDKIEDNIQDIKHELAPKNLMVHLLATLWDKVMGKSGSSGESGAEGGLDSELFKSGLEDIAKDLFSEKKHAPKE